MKISWISKILILFCLLFFCVGWRFSADRRIFVRGSGDAGVLLKGRVHGKGATISFFCDTLFSPQGKPHAIIKGALLGWGEGFSFNAQRGSVAQNGGSFSLWDGRLMLAQYGVCIFFKSAVFTRGGVSFARGMFYRGNKIINYLNGALQFKKGTLVCSLDASRFSFKTVLPVELVYLFSGK